MRELNLNDILTEVGKFLNFYLENWELWVFYIIGYLFVLFFTNKTLVKLQNQVADDYSGTSHIKKLYLSIKIAIRELRESESKVFYAFIVATITINFYSLFEPITKIDSIPTENIRTIKFFNFLMLLAYNGLIYVLPNYSRYKTFKKLYKTFV